MSRGIVLKGPAAAAFMNAHKKEPTEDERYEALAVLCHLELHGGSKAGMARAVAALRHAVENGGPK